jgi:hypothetical protein
MTDLITLAETTARDPLIGAFALMAVGVLVSPLLLKQQPICRHHAIAAEKAARCAASTLASTQDFDSDIDGSR